jgi:hypothetical protein
MNAKPRGAADGTQAFPVVLALDPEAPVEVAELALKSLRH